MQIQLKEEELKVAVQGYIMSMGITGPVGEVNFSATRGPGGIVTEVEIGQAPAAVVTPTVPVALLTDPPQSPAKAAEKSVPVAQKADKVVDEKEDGSPLPASTKKLFG